MTPHRERANHLGDEVRKYLAWLNSGGIAGTFALATQIEPHFEINIKTLMFAPLMFGVGLFFTGVSWFAAKHRETVRADAEEEEEEAGMSPPKFNEWIYSKYWDTMSGVLFFVGVLGIWLSLLSGQPADTCVTS